MLWSRVASSSAIELVDRSERRLIHQGRNITLSQLPWQLLLALVERPGRLVTRSELKRNLWPNTARIDTERRLNTAIRALRAALGDGGNRPRLIETVRGRGYRWIGTSPTSQSPVQRAYWTKSVAALLIAAGTWTSSWHPEPLSLDGLARERTTVDVLRAQVAVEQWRAEPTTVRFDEASQRVGAASSAHGDRPALLALQAELAIGGRWDWRNAELFYRKALALDPSHPEARLGLAWLEVNRGRRAEAIALVQDLIPDLVLTDEKRASLGWLLLRAGRPDLAVEACGAPGAENINTLSCQHSALAGLSRFDAARGSALKLMAASGADRKAIDAVRSASPRVAYDTFLHWRAEHFLPDDASWFQQAQVLADAGLVDRSLGRLERSVRAREPMAVKIASTPSFAGFGTNPRYRTLLRAVGLGA
jgi:DNA-binding winged helix-turn-helix (wHTH) protein